MAINFTGSSAVVSDDSVYFDRYDAMARAASTQQRTVVAYSAVGDRQVTVG